jgi:AcrR family transcriptional regulator
MEDPRLKREDWLRTARLALRRGGPDSVRIERLARHLGVTKGSFYWHFKDRDELLEALLKEWEDETSMLLGNALACFSIHDAVVSLMDEVQQRVILSEQGGCPSDAAIFAWASISPEVALRVNRIEQRRIDMLTRLTGRPDRADLFYYAYLGFIMRRSRVPSLTDSFPLLAAMLSEVLLLTGEDRVSLSRTYEEESSTQESSNLDAVDRR